MLLILKYYWESLLDCLRGSRRYDTSDLRERVEYMIDDIEIDVNRLVVEVQELKAMAKDLE